MEEKPLSFSFVIPTYNAEPHLERCLRAIRWQDYPQEKIEILVADGGSSDRTLEIAGSYRCRIINNPRRLAEYGIQLGVEAASGDLMVDFAADNELVGRDWAMKVSGIFSADREISAVWGRLASGQEDSSLNRYFELIQSDPLSWFLNKNLLYYKRLSLGKADGPFIFKVDPLKPLVWGANGLTYRTPPLKRIWSQEGYLGDNDAFQYLIESGSNKVAYFDSPFVYHHHVARLRDWVAKWRRNLLHHLLDKHQTRNMNWAFTPGFVFKVAGWIFYSIIFPVSLAHSIFLALRDRNAHWLYHPLVSFLQAVVYLFLVFGTHKGRGLVFGLLSKKRSK